VASTWKPTYLWLRTSRHWTKPLLINAYVIEHRDGIVLFDRARTGRRSPRPALLPRRRHRILYDRLAARFDIGPGDTLTARLEAIGYDLADVRTAVLSHLHQNHIGGLPEFERRPGARISR
jgi:glyoxylase-like metal-dependent hydrolase (beta-lactamase superfamily II)